MTCFELSSVAEVIIHLGGAIAPILLFWCPQASCNLFNCCDGRIGTEK